MTTTPQVRLTALYRNSGARSSGKKESSSLTLAAQIASQVGMVRTWPNVQTIRLAIESESEYSDISIAHAAALIAQAATELTAPGSPYCPPDWRDQVHAFKANRIDRFWFEDSRWRTKSIYDTLLARLQESA